MSFKDDGFDGKCPTCGQAFHGWISVNEHMPTDGTLVVCRTKYTQVFIGFYDEARQGFFELFYGNNKRDHVTHWLLIPAAPEGER